MRTFIKNDCGVFICIFLFSLNSFSKEKLTKKVESTATPSPSSSSTPASVNTATATESPAPTSKLLWDSWYTVSIGGKIPYGYYHDKVEEKGGKIAFQNQYWKREEGYINEEQLVAFSENTALVAPLLFNFKSNYRETEIIIDGTFKNDVLTVKVRQNKKDLPKIVRSEPKGIIFSSQFPVWLGKNMAHFKVGKKENFKAILEDNLDKKYQPVSGWVTLEAEDETTKKTETKKISIDYNNQKSIWYVKTTGETEKITIKGAPGAEIMVEKVTENAARRYLMDK